MLFSRRGPGRPPSANVLQTATMRQFHGLWNPSDTELNLRSDYSKWMTNIELGSDGSPTVRYGYRRSFGHYQSAREPAVLVIKPTSNYLTVQSDRWVAKGTRIRVSNVPEGDYKGISSADINTILTVTDVGDGEFSLLLDDWTDSTAGNINLNIYIQETVSDKPYVKGLQYNDSYLAFTNDGWLLEFFDGGVHALWSPNIGHYQGLIDDTATITIHAGEQWASITFTDNEDLDPEEPIRLFVDAPIGDYTAAELNRYFNIVSQSYDGVTYRHFIRLPRIATTTVTDVPIDGQYNISEDWAAVDHISYAQFGQRITFTNGVDKPIVLDWTNDSAATYLVDPATGSNLNTPVAKYVVAGSSFMIHIGLVNNPGFISISATNTDNTYLGDPGSDNDAVEINVAKTAVDPYAQPTGGIFHNGLLFIFFEDATVIYRLGVYDADVHKPELVQVIQSFGCISHDALASIGQNLLTVDTSGVVSIQETLVGDTFKPVRLSELISNELVRAITAIDSSMWPDIHFAYDKRLGRYLLFVPDYTGNVYTTFVYQRLEERKIAGWYKYTNLNFRTAFRDRYNRIFGAIGNVFYQIGNDHDPIYTDDGSPISFVWELPWIDFKARTNLKHARYLTIESQGTARFLLELFVDYIYEDIQTMLEEGGTYDEFTTPLLPESTVEYMGGDIVGYGGGTEPYGTGRRTNDPRPYTWTARFKVAKLRFSGSTSERLSFVSISIAYQLGGIYR